MSNKKVVLAYSGGLDTSCILKWLIEKGYEVIGYCANIGQDENFEEVKKKALLIGASKVIVDDLRSTFVEDYVWPSIKAGIIYEARYLLGTSIARPCISVGLVKCAKENNVKYIAHGATGKGNDQIRFELACMYLHPDIKIIAPWRIEEFYNRFKGRKDLLKYAQENNIPVSVTPSSPWSMDENLMHISYESGILEDPYTEPPKDLYILTNNPITSSLLSSKIEISFCKGIPSKLKTVNEEIIEPLRILEKLNVIGRNHGVGRIDIVENRLIGLKSRGVYETPGCHILYVAHKDLELFCLDKEVYRVQEILQSRLSDYVYNGLWFSPESKYINDCISLSQVNVNGKVKLEICRGNVFVLGRSSPTSTYNEDLVSMDTITDFTPCDVTGYINVLAIRLKEWSKNNIKSENKKYDKPAQYTEV